MKLNSKLAFIIITLYCFSYLATFWTTPLGQAPVLDGAENILLAQQIHEGTLPKEPFFRSMLYPALLSVSFWAGYDTPKEVFRIASLFGMISHIASVFLIFLCCKNLWKNTNIATIASLLYGLYPPAVFFAGEPLDTTVSITFMLGSLLFLFYAIDSGSTKNYVLSGFLLGIASLLRSNLLPFGVVYIVYAICNKKQTSKCAISAFLVAAMLVLSGLIGFIHSGQFKIMPWQGASNFYKANSLCANGKYFRQSIILPDRQLGTNPARAEAEIVYSNETGEKPPFDLNKFNKFWITKSFQEIKQSPLHWFSLMGKKIYYLLNNYEQYNNKTFSFHKAHNLILKYNPLCYGFVLILFILSLFNLKKLDLKSGKILCLVFGLMFLSLGIIIFYVSSRFRLPIASLLIIFGSGLFLHNPCKIVNLKNGIIAMFCCLISFSTLFDVADKSTWLEDKLLNAFACTRLGYDKELLMWCNEVIKESPYNHQAIRLKIVAFSNLILSGNKENLTWDVINRELEYLYRNNLFFDDCLFLLGCYSWRTEKKADIALKLWSAEKPGTSLFLLNRACIIYTKLGALTETDLVTAKTFPFLAAAIAQNQKIDVINDNYPLVKSSHQILSFLLD